ncbi:MAG TPA: tetratricopeptide repeat protein [Thermomicrobiales bacterium]|nr:tetratricopeptide repeat protein [Thermomicrobiales bacterium]
MSSPKRPATPRRSQATTPRRSAPPNRNQILLVITSVLVICSLIGGVFVGLGASDIFGDLFDGDTADEENYIDPNSDLISAQQTIVANSPDDVENVLLLASLLANSGRLADSIPHYEHVMDLAPDDVAARLSFARALADGGMQADAELQFERVLEMDPNSQQAHYYLAELYMASSPQRVDEAIVHYRAAAEIDTTTLIGERGQTQLDTLGAGTTVEASPVASPSVTPVG